MFVWYKLYFNTNKTHNFEHSRNNTEQNKKIKIKLFFFLWIQSKTKSFTQYLMQSNKYPHIMFNV
jgi:hypothetical protein